MKFNLKLGKVENPTLNLHKGDFTDGLELGPANQRPSNRHRHATLLQLLFPHFSNILLGLLFSLAVWPTASPPSHYRYLTFEFVQRSIPFKCTNCRIRTPGIDEGFPPRDTLIYSLFDMLPMPRSYMLVTRLSIYVYSREIIDIFRMDEIQNQFRIRVP